MTNITLENLVLLMKIGFYELKIRAIMGEIPRSFPKTKE
jgi:hypothetical protein